MIQIQDVSFEYEKEQGTLSHIDLNIQQGECVVLTGESGCGKTTVTKLINGLIPHFVEGGTLSGTSDCKRYGSAENRNVPSGRAGWLRVPKSEISVFQY